MLDQKQDSAATEENDPEISQSWRTGGRHFWLHPGHARATSAWGFPSHMCRIWKCGVVVPVTWSSVAIAREPLMDATAQPVFYSSGGLLPSPLTSCVQVRLSWPRWRLQGWWRGSDRHWLWLKSETRNGSVRCDRLAFMSVWFSFALLTLLSAGKQVSSVVMTFFVSVVLESSALTLRVKSICLWSPGCHGNSGGPRVRSFPGPPSAGVGLPAVLLRRRHAQLHLVETSWSS